MRDRNPAIAFGGDNRLNFRRGKLRADGVGVIAFVSEQSLDAVVEHPEKWAKTLHVVSLARGQEEAERPTMSIATGVELGAEAAARAAKPLGLLIPFFRPTAQ